MHALWWTGTILCVIATALFFTSLIIRSQVSQLKANIYSDLLWGVGFGTWFVWALADNKMGLAIFYGIVVVINVVALYLHRWLLETTPASAQKPIGE